MQQKSPTIRRHDVWAALKHLGEKPTPIGPGSGMERRQQASRIAASLQWPADSLDIVVRHLHDFALGLAPTERDKDNARKRLRRRIAS